MGLVFRTDTGVHMNGAPVKTPGSCYVHLPRGGDGMPSGCGEKRGGGGAMLDVAGRWDTEPCGGRLDKATSDKCARPGYATS